MSDRTEMNSESNQESSTVDIKELNFNSNTGIAEETIRSLGEFCDVVDKYTNAWRNRVSDRIDISEISSFPGELSPWFRGLSDEGYACEPGLLRKSNYKYFPKDFERSKEQEKKDDIQKIEYYLLQRFKNYGSYLISRHPSHDIQWLFLMQHHSLLTRLLDWSKSSLTALFFAIKKYDEKQETFRKWLKEKMKTEDIRQDKKIFENVIQEKKKRLLPNAVVWMIEPRKLSELCHSSRGIYGANNPEHLKFIDQNYLDLSKITDERLPLPLIPDFISPRITSQIGRFTFHSHKQGGIKKFARRAYEEGGDDTQSMGYVVKIIIPNEVSDCNNDVENNVHKNILRSLRVAGMSQVNIKQDLDGVSEELMWRMRLGKDDRYPMPGDNS